MNRLPLRLALALALALALVLSLALAAALPPAAAAQPSPDPSPAREQSHSARIVRVSGDSRVATAVEASRHTFPGGADTVVIAAARRFPDALAAVPLAVREDAPLLLVEERTGALVLEEIGRLGAGRALLMAAFGAVPAVVELELQRAGLVVERVAGDGRFHTAARIGHRLGAGAGGEAVVVSGGTFADALPAGPLAARTGAPVVLTDVQDIPPDTAALLTDLGVRRTVLVGGRAAVGDAVAAALPEATRLSGRDRYRTSVAVARELVARGGSLATVAIATGRDFADALAAGPAVARSGGPLLLVDGQDAANAGAVYAYLAEHRAEIGQVLVFGGSAAITDAVRLRLAEALRGGA